MEGEHDIARRTVLMSAGVGIGAGLVSGMTSARAEAPTGGADVWSSEYWTDKRGTKLNLWRKRVGAPKPGEKPLPILFLVHGSSNSARSSYDLDVPGKRDYSMMNVMAREGYDVWTMDHDGYGYSGSSGNNSDIASGVEDLKAAMPVIAKETGQHKMHMYGTSSGGIRAAAFAQTQPANVDRLILSAFTYKGEGAEEIARRRKRIDEYRANPRRKRDAEMIRSIFTRDGHPGSSDPEVPEAIIAMEAKFGDTIPTGTYLDMAANLPIVDPKKVVSPVLMIRGTWDGNSTNEDLLDFYAQLPNGDRQFVILPDTAHSPGYGKNRHLLFYAVKNFLSAPAPVAAS
jgi:pimeloyl-ACP methyl ester carboxylesterase